MKRFQKVKKKYPIYIKLCLESTFSNSMKSFSKKKLKFMNNPIKSFSVIRVQLRKDGKPIKHRYMVQKIRCTRPKGWIYDPMHVVVKLWRVTWLLYMYVQLHFFYVYTFTNFIHVSRTLLRNMLRMNIRPRCTCIHKFNYSLYILFCFEFVFII